MMKQTITLWPACLLVLALSGCADDVTTTADASGTGAIGAPCESNGECGENLVCEENVCGPVEAIPDTTGSGDTASTDVITEDTAAEDTVPVEDVSAEDTPTDDAALADTTLEDTAPDEDTTFSDTVEDAITDALDWDTIKSDCEELGIANDWTGEFSGVVTHDLVIPPEFGTPPADDLPVSGELTFAIECIDSKFKVDGKLDGFAVSAGENYPFTLTLEGYYNPETKKLSADIVEGMVLVIIAEVYFTGVFDGELVTDEEGNDTFAGTWFGEADGTNLGELIQGDASAQGTWNASPSDALPEETP